MRAFLPDTFGAGNHWPAVRCDIYRQPTEMSRCGDKMESLRWTGGSESLDRVDDNVKKAIKRIEAHPVEGRARQVEKVGWSRRPSQSVKN